eukprot:6483971-Amphidinium_carterae.1
MGQTRLNPPARAIPRLRFKLKPADRILFFRIQQPNPTIVDVGSMKNLSECVWSSHATSVLKIATRCSAMATLGCSRSLSSELCYQVKLEGSTQILLAFER